MVPEWDVSGTSLWSIFTTPDPGEIQINCHCSIKEIDFPRLPASPRRSYVTPEIHYETLIPSVKSNVTFVRLILAKIIICDFVIQQRL